MAKKRINNRKRYFNTYAGGGLLGNFANWNNKVTNDFMKSGIGSSLKKLGIDSNSLGGIASSAASMVSGAINPNGNSTKAGDAISSIGSAVSNIPGIGGVIGAGLNLTGGLVNTVFGSKLNEDFINQTETKTAQQAGYTSSAKDNASLLSDWSSYTDLAHVRQSDVGSDGWFSNKAKNKTKSLNNAIDKANLRAWYSLGNTASNVDKNNDALIMSNFAAYGGPITMRYSGPMSPFGNTFAEGGGIHIKKKNRGKFTEYCGGKVTDECIQRGLHSSNPTTRKRANFARNARKWHSFGGWLNSQGGDFTNGVTYVDNGGTHEENPFEGVQMGIDNEGVPNLVEEGEVVYNDYVFSNRIKVPSELKSKYHISGSTFAEAAKELSKESEERPNDPISKNGLKAFMAALANSQEEIRMNKESKTNKFAKGGKLFDFKGPSFDKLIPDLTSAIVGTLPSVTDIDKTPISKSLVKESPRTYNPSNLSYLRFAPALMSGMASFTDLFSEPDYEAADRIASIDIQPSLVSASPVGQYMSYKPLDKMFYINNLNKNAGATRRAINNNSGGNRAAAMAGILSADYNYGESLGTMARQAEEYNQALMERVKGFNRQTDMFNSQQSLQAQATNAQSRNDATKMRLAQAEEVARYRQAAKDAYNLRRSNNLNSFITNLGNIGWEEYQKNMINSNQGLYYGLLGEGRLGYKNSRKNGGKLKKKRRNTYA